MHHSRNARFQGDSSLCLQVALTSHAAHGDCIACAPNDLAASAMRGMLRVAASEHSRLQFAAGDISCFDSRKNLHTGWSTDHRGFGQGLAASAVSEARLCKTTPHER